MSLEKKIQKEVDARLRAGAKVIAERYIQDRESLLKAFETALKIEGFGDKRITRVTENMNLVLPTHLRMESVNK